MLLKKKIIYSEPRDILKYAAPLPTAIFCRVIDNNPRSATLGDSLLQIRGVGLLVELNLEKDFVVAVEVAGMWRDAMLRGPYYISNNGYSPAFSN